MRKVEKRSDLHREWAKVLDMVEGTKADAGNCVKIDGLKNVSYFPRFDLGIDRYEFALAIIDDKPVFVGDELNYSNGTKFIATGIDDAKSMIFSGVTAYIIEGCSWNAPKPKTFNLNGVEAIYPFGLSVHYYDGERVGDMPFYQLDLNFKSKDRETINELREIINRFL